MSFRVKFILLFLFLYAFRVAFGLSKPFFSPDELQTYLIGLKCYTEGIWPFFGPDLIVTETGFYTQIPGALEGLLLGLPFYFLPIPEAPFLFLNLLTTSALALLSWYLSKRLKEIPFFFIFPWLALLPWNLHESTNPINPSFLLIGSSLFFIGFLEALPGISLKWLKPNTAFAWMGFGLFWNMQFHFSWVLLPPFILGALILRWRKGSAGCVKEGLALAAGGALPLAFLIPTLVKYGLSQGAGGMALSVGFNRDNFLSFFTILARYLSLPCFELPRFIALSSETRWAFFKENPWLAPPGFFLILLGLVQPFVLLIWGWFKDPKHKDAKSITRLTFLGLLWVWMSFWFTSKEPAAHMYYILLPLVAVHSFYIGSRLARDRRWRLFGIACIMANLWFTTGYVARMMKTQSLYTNRAQVEKAIQEKNYRVLGERRPGSIN